MNRPNEENQSPLGPVGPSPFGSGGLNLNNPGVGGPVVGGSFGGPGPLGGSPAGPPGDCGEPDCTGALASLYPYLDGDLDADRRMLVAAHINDCPPCFAAFDFESVLRGVVATKCRDRVPETLRNKIREAILEDPGNQ